MVVVTHDRYAAVDGHSVVIKWVRHCSVYLYTILIMSRIDIIKTINILTIAVLIVYSIFGIKWLIWIAILLAFGNALESRITAAVANYWMRFALKIGYFNSMIILFIMFFFMLTPIAFIYRLFNREKVYPFRKNLRKSYFDDIHKSCRKDDFEKLW